MTTKHARWATTQFRYELQEHNRVSGTENRITAAFVAVNLLAWISVPIGWAVAWAAGAEFPRLWMQLAMLLAIAIGGFSWVYLSCRPGNDLCSGGKCDYCACNRAQRG